MRNAIDLCTVEVNRSEITRYVAPERRRLAWLSSEISIPTRRQQFDVFVHEDLFDRMPPRLRLFDTVITGIVDVNDPSSEADEFEIGESLEELGRGIGRARSSVVPGYHRMLGEVLDKAGIDQDALRGYRSMIEYPVYGCQTTMLFQTVAPPSGD